MKRDQLLQIYELVVKAAIALEVRILESQAFVELYYELLDFYKAITCFVSKRQSH